MSGLLKNILIVLLILTIGAWIFTVARSCKQQDPTVVENPVENDGNEDGNTETDLEDLYDDDENDGTEGDGENLDSENFDSEENTDDELADLEKELNVNEEDDEGLDEEEALDSDDESSTDSASGSDDQRHLVIAGSYLSEVNAKILLKQLKKSGYDDAEIVVFDFSQYHTVCAGRFSSSREAHAIKRKLINQEKIPQAYVHTKRPRKK